MNEICLWNMQETDYGTHVIMAYQLGVLLKIKKCE